jgi:hypothetical protein
MYTACRLNDITPAEAPQGMAGAAKAAALNPG